MVTSYLIPASAVNLSPLGRPLGWGRCLLLFLRLFPDDHHLPARPRRACSSPPLRQDTAAATFNFSVSLICSRARTNTQVTNFQTRILSYWYPRNRRLRHDPPRPLYIRPRFVLCQHSVRRRPTTGSTDTSCIPHSEPSPVHPSPLFSLPRIPTSIAAREQLPRPGSQGSGRVEQWIEDQRGGDQDPSRLSPMPRHSDTIAHSRRFTPVAPRTPTPRQDASDFVFVDDDEEVSARELPMVRVSDWIRLPLSFLPRVGTRYQTEWSETKDPRLRVAAPPVYSAILPPRSRAGGCRSLRR